MHTPLDRLTTALASHYRIEREIGAGGMATVYLAEDVKHHRKVAVKVLRPELAATIGPDRFAREIEVAARLQHPHILGLLDSGEAGGFFYYVMPYVEGETLRDRLSKHGEFPVPEALRLLNEIADALSVAHKGGVVHRDIKPENVLLSGRHAMVMDFGVAKAVTEASGRQQLTTAGVALGTPAYMAPEQATADPHLDGRVDIYALGVLAYEMLTGKPPFHGLTPQQTLAAHVTQAPESVGRRRPGLAPALEAVVMRCLAKRPADRYQTADELVAVLEPLATPSGGMTPTQTRPTPAVARLRRIPPWMGWAAGGAAVAAGALAMTLFQRQPDTLAIGRRTAVAVSPELEVHPSLSRDGKMLLYTVQGRGTNDLYAQQVDGGTPVPLTTRIPGDQGFGVLSPDGTRVLFLSARGLEVMPALGGQARVVAGRPAGSASWGNWSADGTRVVYGTLDTLYVTPIDADNPTVVATGTQVHSAAWSPDGRWIAYVNGNVLFHVNGNLAPSEIRVVPAAGGPSIVVAAGSFNTSPIWVPGRRALLFISNRDGGRDIYEVFLKGSGAPSGPPVRLTTGLDAEWITISADGRRLAWSEYTETSNVWSLPIPARDSVPVSQATQITSGTQDIENVAVSPDGAWLYYDSDRSGNQDIWRQPLGREGAPEQVTTDPADDFDPSVSPDGRSVAFHSLRTGNRDIFVVPTAGGRTTQVSASPAEEMNAYWAPRGRVLAWDRQFAPDSSLWTASERADGTWEPARPLPVGPNGGVPRWSPDGRSILFSSLHGVTVLDLQTLRSHEVDLGIVGGPAGISVWGDWSADGRTIYVAMKDSVGRFVIRAASPAGGRTRVIAFANDPNAQAHRFGFAVRGGRFYFPLMNRKSDIWVAEVGAP